MDARNWQEAVIEAAGMRNAAGSAARHAWAAARFGLLELAPPKQRELGRLSAHPRR